MNNSVIMTVTGKFREFFNGTPLIIRSPGRINLIGEHTDYNDGFVMPGAINKAVYFAVTVNNSDIVRIHSCDLNDSYEFDICNPQRSGIHWADYIIGTAAEIQRGGYKLKGFDCVFGGDIPIGAGLSSSAAVCAGIAFGINELFKLGIHKKALAKFAQLAEHNFAGVNCGIMDQFINLFGERDRVLKLDCRTLEYERVPFNFPSVSIVLCDSGIKHSLASTEYNIRRTQCESGVSIIRERYPGVQKLRDVNIDMLEEFENIIPSKIFSRCRYVVEENQRLLQASDYLKENNITRFGELLSLTHEALRIDYEVSVSEIDTLVHSALDMQGVFGSRMMGGGFGGCTLNLVENERAGFFKEKMQSVFRKAAGRELKFYDPVIESGTIIIQ